MAALTQKITIYSPGTDTVLFEGTQDDLISVNYETTLDVIGSELTNDVSKVVLRCPVDSEYDLTAIPYGSEILYEVYSTQLSDYEVKFKHYVKEVERKEKEEYAVNSVSAFGILANQYHKGGIYNGELFEDVIEEIIDGSVDFECDEDCGAVPLYGYLPYATKTENIHTILYAEGISAYKTEEGNIHFAFFDPSESAQEIVSDKIFSSGSVKYPPIATRVEVIEHSYQYVDSIERITLVDNSEKASATGQTYFFDSAPIYVPSLEATEGLTIIDAGVNYVTLQGNGVLTGIPYYDKTETIIKTNTEINVAYIPPKKDNTMITAANSENVADRLLSYYTSKKNVKNDIIVTDEKCGKLYTFTDRFDEEVTAFMTKMKVGVSSLLRSACEYIAGYIPQKFGNVYKYSALTAISGSFTVSEGTENLRLLLVGGGDGGSSGLKGLDDDENLLAGSKGGEPGEPGEGGYILEISIHNPEPGEWTVTIGHGGTGGAECHSATERNYGTAGTATIVTSPGGTVYTTFSSDAYRSKYGVKSILGTEVYGKKGRDGVKGGDGGRGSISGIGEAGQDVTFRGKTFKGGKGGSGLKFTFTHVIQSVDMGGAGGNGASATEDGRDGGDASIVAYFDETSSRSGYSAYEWGKFSPGIPSGGQPVVYESQEYSFGDGGDAGHGGAGRGGWGQPSNYEQRYISTDNTKVYLSMRADSGYVVGESMNGFAGKDGKSGIALAFADKPITATQLKYTPPDVYNASWDSTANIVKAYARQAEEPTSGKYSLLYRYASALSDGLDPEWGSWTQWYKSIAYTETQEEFWIGARTPEGLNVGRKYEVTMTTLDGEPDYAESDPAPVLTAYIYKLPKPSISMRGRGYDEENNYFNVDITRSTDFATSFKVLISKATETFEYSFNVPEYDYETLSLSLVNPYGSISDGEEYKFRLYAYKNGYLNSQNDIIFYTYVAPEPEPEENPPLLMMASPRRQNRTIVIGAEPEESNVEDTTGEEEQT